MDGSDDARTRSDKENETMALSTVHNEREHTRHEVSVEVVVAAPDCEPITLKTGNISQGGVFLLRNGHEPLPSVGTEFVATLNEFLGDMEPMAMRGRVVRRDANGIAVEFLGPV
jgi:hypothetical protein